MKRALAAGLFLLSASIYGSDGNRLLHVFEGSGVYVSDAKVGLVKFHKSQDIQGTPKNVTISKRAGEWYMAVQVEIEVAEPKHPSDKEIGIDMGIANFATISDGHILKPHYGLYRLVSICRLRINYESFRKNCQER